MKLRVRTAWRETGLALTQSWELSGLGPAELVHEGHDRYELRHRRDLPIREMNTALEALLPLRPPTRAMDWGLEGDLELLLGHGRRLSSWKLTLHTDSTKICDELTARLAPLAMSSEPPEIGRQARNTLKYGGAPPIVRDLIKWHAAAVGVSLGEEKEWGDEDFDVWVYVRDPAMEGRPAREFARVDVESDDPEAAERLVERLRAEGFAHAQIRPLLTDGTWGRRFLVAPGRLGWEDGGSDLDRLERALSELLRASGVDAGRFPVTRHDAVENDTTRISLPLLAWGRGSLRPYAGPWPERFDVRVRTEEPARAAGLERSLREAGFERVLFEQIREEEPLGFVLRWGEAATVPKVAEQLRALVTRAMREVGAPPAMELATWETPALEQEVTIDFPVHGLEDGSLEARILETASAYNVSLRCPMSEHTTALMDKLREMGFLRLQHLEHLDAPEAAISYGGAPPALIAHVRRLIEAHTGLSVPTTREWSETDNDIWISLPGAGDEAGMGAEGDAEEVDFGAWLDPEPPEATRSFIEVGPDRVRVGRVELPRWPGPPSHLAPRPAAFEHYCLDAGTAATLEHVALSVALREPCLLEGETSTSKTSSILFLASLLGQPVVRINLNGQTDTGELVGRYAPEELPAPRPGPGDQGDAPPAGLQGPAWRWQDGLIVQALRHGWWVILDELNLAEPQILERLNSLLERDPMLVMTEHDNRVIGAGGAPVHPAFRIFGTMNPAEYAGRSVLSPAYRDRWVGYRHAPPPDEHAYLAMLRLLVFGEQPEVEVLGHRWRGEGDREPPLMALLEVEGIDDLLVSIARFHATLRGAVGAGRAGGRWLGQGAREPYVFTRRGLLRLMDYVAGVVGLQGAADDPTRRLREALVRYYVGRMRTAADRTMMARLLDAAGIGPGTWQPGATAPAEPVPPPGPGHAPRERLDDARPIADVERLMELDGECADDRELDALAELSAALATIGVEPRHGLDPDDVLREVLERLDGGEDR